MGVATLISRMGNSARTWSKSCQLRQVRSASHGGPTPMEISMVKGQYGGDCINNRKEEEEEEAKVNIINRRANTGKTWSCEEGLLVRRERPTSVWHWQGPVWSRRQRRGHRRAQRLQSPAGVLQVRQHRPYEEGLPQRQAQGWTLLFRQL